MLNLLILLIGVLFLLIMIVKFKINTFVSLIVVSVLLGLGLRMPIAQIPISIMDGIGGSLNELVVVCGFGAVLGRLVSDAGGAYRISKTLVNFFGKKHIQWAIVISSFIIGISLFFEVGMVLLIPIVFAIALEAEIPLLYLGIPASAGLIVTHGFLPPHPAPTAVSEIFGASPGTVLIYGIIITIPSIIIAGPIFAKIAKRFVPEAFVVKDKLNAFGEIKKWKLEETPSFKISILTSLLPVILMTISTLYVILFKGGHALSSTTTNINGVSKTVFPMGIDGIMMFLGNPVAVMIISLSFAMWSMGWYQKKTSKEIATSTENAIKSIAMLLLIIGGGSALKQILIDGGISNQIALIFSHSSFSPLILAWIITVILRISLGSATVAAMTSAGLISKIIGTMSPDMSALMVLAIGAGSIAASHVNDAGFWMFKEYFDLDIKQTLKTWTVLDSIVSFVGICIIMFMSIWIH